MSLGTVGIRSLGQDQHLPSENNVFLSNEKIFEAIMIVTYASILSRQSVPTALLSDLSSNVQIRFRALQKGECSRKALGVADADEHSL